MCLPFLVLFFNLETGHLIFSLELACFEKDIPPELGEDAVISMVYEANARLRDPVYGCVASVAALQLHASQLQQELASALNTTSNQLSELLSFLSYMNTSCS